MIRTHAKSHELVRDIVGTILAETLVEICRAGGTVSSALAWAVTALTRSTIAAMAYSG